MKLKKNFNSTNNTEIMRIDLFYNHTSVRTQNTFLASFIQSKRKKVNSVRKSTIHRENVFYEHFADVVQSNDLFSRTFRLSPGGTSLFPRILSIILRSSDSG